MQINNIVKRLLALLLIIVSSPLFFLIGMAIKSEDRGDIFFRQKRWGKGKRSFLLLKFRTMIKGAEGKKSELMHLNEADGPVFKIQDDPRFTGVGRFLAHTGLDELPQLFNIIKGEMAFIGPRPLPPSEAKRVKKNYRKRFLILPGITSSWVVEGAHNLTFDKWMKLDIDYVKHKSLALDVRITFQTIGLIISQVVRTALNKGK